MRINNVIPTTWYNNVSHNATSSICVCGGGGGGCPNSATKCYLTRRCQCYSFQFCGCVTSIVDLSEPTHCA